jgi:pyridinium-3,5-biscarboxylic acid mononucleotide synthase
MENMLHFDSDRRSRVGFDEAVLAEGKTREDLLIILQKIGSTQPLLVTRMNGDVYKWCRQEAPDLLSRFVFNERARVLRSKKGAAVQSLKEFSIAVITAGTSDRYVAEEVTEVLKFYQVPFEVFADVGVAGIHRLLSQEEGIKKHNCVICVAGMDGALASVVAGLFPMPVIGVPTSVGYGSSQNGKAALLSMLNSCAQGLCVMNIDNGFGAAMAALRLNNQIFNSAKNMQ